MSSSPNDCRATISPGRTSIPTTVTSPCSRAPGGWRRRGGFLEDYMGGLIRPPCDAGVIRATPAFTVALSEKRKRLTLAATILGSSMAFIDGSVVNIALPAIQQALHADAISTQWIVNAYRLLLGALVLVGGSAAELYGRRRIFLVSFAVSTTPSLPCGLVPNSTRLSISRAV